MHACMPCSLLLHAAAAALRAATKYVTLDMYTGFKILRDMSSACMSPGDAERTSQAVL